MAYFIYISNFAVYILYFYIKINMRYNIILIIIYVTFLKLILEIIVTINHTILKYLEDRIYKTFIVIIVL